MTRILVAALVIVGVSAACRSNPDRASSSPRTGAEADTATTSGQQFNDIPIPEGYRMQNERLQSYVTEAASYRAGHLYYTGNGRTLDAVSYFEQRMPHHGWTLVDRSTTAEGPSSMIWRKGSTAAKIEIAANSKSGLVDIEIRVGTSLDPNYRP
jgi:hypothetical protein